MTDAKFRYKDIKFWYLWIFSFFFIMYFVNSTYAMEFVTGQNIDISLTNATTGELLTGNTCYLDISNNTQSNYTFIPMTDNSDGTYTWNINASIVANLTHPYTAKANCTVGTNQWFAWNYFYVVDEITLNKTDYVASNPADYQADISSLATRLEIYNNTLSQFNESGDTVNITQSALTNIATSVWASATRTLTSFGTLINDIWTSASRTLTSFAFTIGLNTSAIDDIDTRINESHGMDRYNTTGLVNVTTNNINNYNSTMNIIIPE